MQPFKANLINAGLLISMGLWAFFSAESRSVTILIPVFFGIVFALFTPAVKRENKVAAHIVVVLTVLIIVALFMPLKGSIGRDDMAAVFRVSMMLGGALFALAIFIKSFRDIRKARSREQTPSL